MLRAVPGSSQLPRITITDGSTRYVSLQFQHFFIDLSIAAASYKVTFSSRTRSTIARKIRKFQEHCGGSLEWRSYRTPDAMSEFHVLARKVSEKTYQEHLLGAS